jgi:hypothetical protein
MINQVDIQSLAKTITDRKLNSISIFILESHKPLARILQNLLIVSDPLLFFLSGNVNWQIFKEILNSQEDIDLLIMELEKKVN